MSQRIEELGMEIFLSYEDPRYPTLVIQGDNYGVGYNLDPQTGELRRICICAAHSSSECVCGAWDIEL
jgi:hypothetical protein